MVQRLQILLWVNYISVLLCTSVYQHDNDFVWHDWVRALEAGIGETQHHL